MPHSKGFTNRADSRSSDPVPIGEVVDRLLAEDVFQRGMPVAKLTRGWPEVVGTRLAEATTPVSLEAGCLVVRAADGPWGSQARYLAKEIQARADEALGGGVITSIRIIVGSKGNRRSEG
jgi:hypothetical protein